jgi:outer membrane receptor protein involved in Fe transport
MKTSKNLLLSSISLAVLALINQQSANAQAVDASAAQASGPQTPSTQAKEAAAEIQQVTVTGTAAGGRRKVDTSFSITTANEEQIKQAAPSSTGDLLKIVPGIMAESTGGQSGANIDVRGFPSGSDSPFVTIALNGSPIYPASTLNFLEGTSLFRIDETIERVEVLRGGPSPIFSSGQVGATVNFILKKGGENTEGSIRETVGTGRLRRTDMFFSGKIGDGLYGSIGGFYRTSNGVRNTQFPADDGGQVTATITKKLDQGEVTFYGRSVNDKNAFYTSIPLMASGSGQNVDLSAYPGIDPLTYTPIGPALRNFRILVGPGQYVHKDLANGRGLNANTFGVDFNQKINGWNVSNKAAFFKGNADTNAIWPGSLLPTRLDQFISATIARTSANAVLAGLPAATGGTAMFADGSGAVSGSTLVHDPAIWSVTKGLQSFSDEIRVSKEIVKNNTLTVGAYLANYTSKDRWYLGNNVLATAETNSRPISLMLNNGQRVTDAGGLLSGPFQQQNTANSARDTAVFLSNEWKINEQIQVDAGVRHQSTAKDITYDLRKTVNLSDDPTLLYDKNVDVLNGATRSTHVDQSAISYTLGGNYKFTKDFSVFVRANSGAAFPDVDTLRGNRDGSPVQKVKQYEVGMKTATPLYTLYLTAFKADFKGLTFLRITPTGNEFTNYGSSSQGLEFEAAVRPIQNLQIALSGAYIDAKYNGNPSIDGNRVTRQPKLQYRLTPSYRIPLEGADLKFYGTYNYVGNRWNDQANVQGLPKYHTLDVGILLDVGENFEFRVSGTNLTNTLATTEGNNQISTATANGPVFGRPLFGRAFELSLGYRF